MSVGRIMPIIFFVILPAVFIVIVIFPRTISSDYFALSMTPLLLYGLSRPDSIEQSLKRGDEQAVVEFETLKKILIVEFPIASIIIALYLIFNIIHVSMEKPSSTPGFSYFFNITFNIMFPIIIVGIGGLYMYGKTISKKEFRFYLSKTCFTTALHKNDIFKQMVYFSLGLQEYDKYLKRHLKHRIKDIDKIFSKVSLLDKDAKTGVICSLSNSFETETDKLKPAKYISSELMKSEDIESFLIPESLKSQLKVVSAFLAASIPIMISIITLVGKFFKLF